MVNVYNVTIGQDDCPHTYITSKIPDLMIFIMNTSDDTGGYQKTFSIFISKNEEELSEALSMLKKYPNVRDISILGVKGTTMSLTYSFPRTSAYKSIRKIGFRLHPVVIRGGQEKWFFVSGEDNVLTETKHRLNDTVTKLISLKRLTTHDFINSYSKLFNEIWKIRIDSQTGGKGSQIIAEALRAGYYDWPRQSSLSNLSKSINMPRSTLTYRLRKVEKKVFEDIENSDL